MASATVSQEVETNILPTVNAEMQLLIDKAAELILNCKAILFTSGAGMGVSSGLGTFRGIAAGVWPPLLKHPGLDFTDMSNPQWFEKLQGNSDQHNTANFGYAFWAYRYNAYTSAAPHHGYEIAKRWSEFNHINYSFSFTSNIDGHWIISGWNESSVLECHGSVHYMQCVDQCRQQIWDTNNALKLNVDPKTDCAIDNLPQCPYCKKLARPNVLMFGDWGFIDNRLDQQRAHYEQFKSNIVKAKAKLLIIELGAGTAVPTVRRESEQMFSAPKWTADLIRINPLVEHSIVSPHYKNNSKGQAIEIALDALTALTLIDEAIKKKLKQ
jgi:NAD-dependent SIR2 family protein deacetylase